MGRAEKVDLLSPPEASDSAVVVDSQAVQDLELDLIVDAMAAGEGEQALDRRQLLSALTRLPLDSDTVGYRSEVFEELRRLPGLEQRLSELLPRIRELGYLAETRRSEASVLRQLLWRLGELELYVECMERLEGMLGGPVRARGLVALREWVRQRMAEELFERLRAELPALHEGVRRKASVTVGINLDERLRPVQAALLGVHEERVEERSLWKRLFGRAPAAQGTAAAVEGLRGIGRLHSNPGPEELGLPSNTRLPLAPLFQELDELLRSVTRPLLGALERYVRLSTAELAALETGITFYLGGCRLRAALQSLGLPLCPAQAASIEERTFRTQGFYNPAFALRLARERDRSDRLEVGREIVLNDVLLDSSSGVLVLTGPNRGGKTTYTRGIGLAQLLAQAGLGCPASAARISPVDRLITHFPRAESGQLEAGRLGEEASRIAAIFEVLTRHSLVLLNESLSCTSPGESLYLAEDVVRALRLAGCRAVFTTHLHELAARAGAINSETPGESAVVSMVAGIQMPDAGDPSAGEPTAAEAKRTFRIEPAPPAGRSFARDVARRHGISLQLLEAKLRERRVL